MHASVIPAAMLSGAIQPWKDHSRQTGPGRNVTVRRPSFNLWGLAGHSLKALHGLALLWDHHKKIVKKISDDTIWGYANGRDHLSHGLLVHNDHRV